MLRFDGRVVVVTGAGGGLGREYALMFGERGAAVVVNDLGGSAHGEGNSSSMADKVVQEIKQRGGKAVANYNSVEDGPKIIKTAIDNFGRVDVVVNNAGILRDKSFQNMSETDWDLIMRVHLKGAYSVSKAAWPYMKKQNFGRIIMTSSNSGVFGNFGQANYSAAKAGLIGLSGALSQEGAKYNVYCNAIVPTAGSRLTQTVMPEDLVNALKPEYIAPLVGWLCHENCQENGGLFEAAAGWFGKVHWVRSEGKVLRKADYRVKPEDVRDSWDQIIDMETAKHYSSMQEVTGQLINVLQAVDSGDSTSSKKPQQGHSSTGGGFDIQAAKSHRFPPLTFEVTPDHTILYALGVGATLEKELHILNEGHDTFSVLPTFAVVPSFGAMGGLGNLPGMEVDLTKLLHGEEYIEFYRPFPSNGKITSQAKVADIVDKGSGAVVLMDVDIMDERRQKIAYLQANIFLRGSGGFGGPRKSSAEKPTVEVPKRQPDATFVQKTSLEQAALYRVASTDHNPLHIDPSFAQMAGFKQPILHGLCSFGYSIRHVLLQYANGDVNKIRAVKGRFSRPVYPGQTLITEMWKEGDRVHFQTKVKETGEVAISGGYVQLHAAAGSGSGNSGSGSKQGDLESSLVFDELKKRLKALPDIAKKTQAVYLWVITKDGKEVGKWTVDLKSGDGEIYEGEPKKDKPGCTLTIEDSNMMPLVTGKLNPQQAFMSGKLKIKGNIMLTQKLQNLLKDQSKL